MTTQRGWHFHFDGGDPNKNKVTQHLPGFVEAEKHVAEFTTVEELRNIDWVAPWINMTPGNYLVQNEDRLMVTSSDGNWWWVIGYLKAPLPFDQVPQWGGVGWGVNQ